MSQYMNSALAQISKNHHNYVMMIIIRGLFFFLTKKNLQPEYLPFNLPDAFSILFVSALCS